MARCSSPTRSSGSATGSATGNKTGTAIVASEAPTTFSHGAGILAAELRLTGELVPEDLSPEMQTEFGEIYKQWRGEG